MLSIFLFYPKESFTSSFKQSTKKDFSLEQVSIDSYILLSKQNNSISIN